MQARSKIKKDVIQSLKNRIIKLNQTIAKLKQHQLHISDLEHQSTEKDNTIMKFNSQIASLELQANLKDAQIDKIRCRLADKQQQLKKLKVERLYDGVRLDAIENNESLEKEKLFELLQGKLQDAEQENLDQLEEKEQLEDYYKKRFLEMDIQIQDLQR